jgi:hypothetical protein
VLFFELLVDVMLAHANYVVCCLLTPQQEPKALDVGIQMAAPGRDNFKTLQDCLNACDIDDT